MIGEWIRRGEGGKGGWGRSIWGQVGRGRLIVKIRENSIVKRRGSYRVKGGGSYCIVKARESDL